MRKTHTTPFMLAIGTSVITGTTEPLSGEQNPLGRPEYLYQFLHPRIARRQGRHNR
jgi:hypothetical protein